MKKWMSLIWSLLISLGVGGLSSLLTRNAGEVYETLLLPAWAPPAEVFPAVWTMLFILMAVSAWLIWRSDSPGRRRALLVYGVQLAVNFVWPLLFFRGRWLLVSFLWLMLLWVLILVMLGAFWRVRPAASLLQLPYFVWVTFAAVLSFSVWSLETHAAGPVFFFLERGIPVP